jgi:hypothetical protein
VIWVNSWVILLAVIRLQEPRWVPPRVAPPPESDGGSV